jgi:uncharacterized protein YjeT (DUF2065 family)
MAANFIRNAELYYFSGATALVVGIAIVLNHNVWTPDWRSVISAIGWISIAKGVIRILFPGVGPQMAAGYVEQPSFLRIGGIVIAVLGAWLSFEGYRAGQAVL